MTDFSVERARAKAKTKEWTVERILGQLASIPQFDYKFWEHCRSMQDELVPALLKAMQKRESIARLSASLLLLHLGQPDGTDGIIACLRDADATLRQQTLLSLSLLPPEPFPFAEDSPFRPPQPVPLKKEPLFAELRQFLSDSNAYHIVLALRAITSMNPSSAELHIQPLLRHPSRDVRIGVLQWYSRRSNSQKAIQVARDLLLAKGVLPTNNYSVIESLEIYCRGKNEALAAEAAKILARFILSCVDYPGNDMANLISNALSGLKAAKYSEERQVVWAVFHSRMKDWRRGAALRRLAEIEGEAQIELLREALSDRTLRQFSAQGIAKVSKDNGDSQLIEALIKAMKEENRASVMRDLVSALIAVEGNSTVSFKGVLELLPLYDAMRVYWLSNEIDPNDAASQLVKVQVIDPPTEELILKIRNKWYEERNASSVVFSLLSSSNRLFWFDREAGTIPVDYVGLLKEFVGIGRGVFDAESFSQQVDETTRESEIQFVYDDRVYTFKARDFGGWYDVESVLQGLNGALLKSGRRERFMLLYTGDQTCAVAFAPEGDFLRVAHRLRLPMEDEYQAAKKAGIAYEQYVRRQLSE